MTFNTELNTPTGSNPGSPSSKSIKIVWQEEIRRLPFNPTYDLQTLKNNYATCFGIRNMNNLVFMYEDSEGDSVTLSSIEELRGLVESNGSIKLHLQRKVTKAAILPQQSQIHDQKPAQPVQLEAETTELKRLKKSQSKNIKKEIVHSKVVRLRWRTTTSIPTVEENKLGRDKGCYVGVNMKGKVNLGAGGKGKNGLWLIHELSNGDIILAPACSPQSHLRVYPNGKTDLTERGAGPRARWGLVNSEDKVKLDSLAVNSKVQLVSRFVPGLSLGVTQELNKNNKSVLRAKGVTLSANAVASEFTVEVQDPVVALMKCANNVTCKKNYLNITQKGREDFEGNNQRKKNNKQSTMSKQERLDAKEARKLDKVEMKRLRVAWKNQPVGN